MSQLEVELEKLDTDLWWDETFLKDQERYEPALEDVFQRVERARTAGRMPVSLLVTGPRGLGRERLAVELAAIMTCPGEGQRGCVCGSCTRVRKGVHPDVRHVPKPNNKKHIVIHQIREIVESVGGRPYEGRARVWILDGVEAGNLGREAANAFLKVLEEPPAHVRFVLLAANPERVLPTIRSRCQRLHLPGPLGLAGAVETEVVAPELLAVVPDKRKKKGESDERMNARWHKELEAARREALDGELVTATIASLEEARGGEPLALILAARRLSGTGDPYQTAALAALELAARKGGAVEGEGLVRLAAELLEAGRMAQILNIKSPDGRITSCFMAWYREAVEG